MFQARTNGWGGNFNCAQAYCSVERVLKKDGGETVVAGKREWEVPEGTMRKMILVKGAS